MGLLVSKTTEVRRQQQRSRQINRTLRQEADDLQLERKLLLLGQ